MRTSSSMTALCARMAVVAVAVAAALMIWSTSRLDSFRNDAAQYVSVSDTFADTGRVATTALYYEIQHAQGMPATQTVWPPGFPLLIGTLHRITGIDSVDLIRATNALSHLAAVLLLFALLRRVCRQPWVAAVLTGCYALHAFSLYLAVSGVSEPLYTVCLLSVGLGVYRAFEHGEHRGWLAMAAVVAGLSCLIRYQALVCALALALSVYAVYWRRGAGQLVALRRAALTLAPFALVFGALVARNLDVAGSITGGPEVAGGVPLLQIAQQVESAVNRLLPGSLRPLPLGLFAVLLLATVMLLIRSFDVLSARGWWLRGPLSEARLGLAVFGLSLFAGTAALVVLLTLRTTVYSFDPRYLAPVLPLLLLGLACFIAEAYAAHADPTALPGHPPHTARSSARERIFVLAVGIGLVGLTAVNLVQWPRFIDSKRDLQTVQHGLDTATAQGTRLKALLIAAGSVSSPILSNQSQLLHLAIRRPTLGVPERRLSQRRWTTADLKTLAARFNVRYVVLFKTMPLGGEGGRNDYLLALDRRTPSWAQVRVSTPEVTLMEIRH